MLDRYVTINCPFCIERGKATPDTKKHLYVYPPGRGVHCFRCGFHTKRYIPDQVKDQIGEVDELGFYLPSPDEPTDAKRRASPEWQARFAGPATKYLRAVSYMEGRKVTKREMDSLGLLYDPQGQFAGRILFPVYDDNGVIRYFTGRAIDKKIKPKYKNCHAPKNGYVYTVGDGSRHGIVCEGPMDAISAAQAGYVGLALFGSAINASQCKAIAWTVNTATVILDPDAFNSSIKVAHELSFYLPTDRRDVPRGTDLGDMNTSTIRSIIARPEGSVAQALLGEEAGDIYRGPR